MRNGWRILMLTAILAGTCLAADPPKASGQRRCPRSSYLISPAVS